MAFEGSALTRIKAHKNWYRYKTRNTATKGKNPWSRLTRELLKQQPKTQPKRLAGWQHWSKIHKAEVTKVAGRGIGIDEWNKVARKMFGELEMSEQEEMARQALESHEAAVERANNPLDGLPSADPADQAAYVLYMSSSPPTEMSFSAREQLATAVVPFLELISEYTGFHCVSLIGACRDEDRGEGFHCHAVHYGETGDVVPKNLATYDPKAYVDFAQYFCWYAQAVVGES